MNWSKTFSSTEYLFIIIFIVVYLIYFLRVFLISRKLNTAGGSVLIKFFLRASYFTLLILALLGPSFGITETEARSTGKDIYIVLDLSNSMNSNDVQPSRLDKIKIEINNLIDQFKTDRIGLIVFGSEAYLNTPLTYDLEALKIDIRSINTTVLPNNGTDFNAAFELVNNKLDNLTSETDRSKVVLLVTDGEDFGNLDNQWFKILKNKNVKSMVLGVGTVEGGKIPMNGGFRKDEFGIEVITRLNLQNLKELATKLGGEYFLINNQTNQLPQLIEKLNLIQEEKIDMRKVMVANNKYQYFLILALLLITFDFLITINIIKL